MNIVYSTKITEKRHVNGSTTWDIEHVIGDLEHCCNYPEFGESAEFRIEVKPAWPRNHNTPPVLQMAVRGSEYGDYGGFERETTIKFCPGCGEEFKLVETARDFKVLVEKKRPPILIDQNTWEPAT